MDATNPVPEKYTCLPGGKSERDFFQIINQAEIEKDHYAEFTDVLGEALVEINQDPDIFELINPANEKGMRKIDLLFYASKTLGQSHKAIIHNGEIKGVLRYQSIFDGAVAIYILFVAPDSRGRDLGVALVDSLQPQIILYQNRRGNLPLDLIKKARNKTLLTEDDKFKTYCMIWR